MRKMNRPKAAILILCGLFTSVSPSLSFAQANDSKKTPPPENAAVAVSGNETDRSLDAGPSVSESPDQTRDESSSSAPNQAPSDQAQANTQGNTQNQTPPSSNSQAPSLEDLGLSPSQTQSDPQLQARLDRRTHMLKIHQRLGLITVVPMIVTVATGFGAGGRSTSTSDRWAHLALGSATGDLYFTTAYFAIFAPRIPGTQTRGQTRVHKALAWIHGPGMILTPILGAIAFNQRSKGERVHGIASAHGAVAVVTAGAYAVALISVSFKF
jgi:hypothetical protein